MIAGGGLGDMVGLRGARCIYDALWAAVRLLEAYSAGAEVLIAIPDSLSSGAGARRHVGCQLWSKVSA